ncbi:MAG TPA: DUF411 domain-containing protein [Trichocoleus sp.]
MKRRLFNQTVLRSLFLSVVGSSILGVRPRQAQAGTVFRQAEETGAATVYRDPACGCCHQWVDYLKGQGFQVTDYVREDMAAVKRELGVPSSMESCHTAVIDGYVIEGHVPAEDIRRLLRERPAAVGIAVPGMPVGTPGMEMSDRKDNFSVVLFTQNGQTTDFNRYEF